MINKINLNNFKCFQKENIECSNLNLLTGLNGMGKSTLFHSLLLLRQNNILRSLRKRDVISLNGDLLNLGNAKDILYQYFENREILIEVKFDQSNKIRLELDASEANIDNIPISNLSISKNFEIDTSSLFNSNFQYLNAERIGPREYYNTSTYNVIYKNRLGIRGEYTANYLAEFQNESIQIKALKHPDVEGNTLKEQVNAWLGEVRPNTRINITPNLDISLVNLTYQFVGGKDVGNKFRPTNVGFGLSYLLPILVAVLSAKPNSLLLIENPEAHLHPKAQVQIGKLLTRAAANGVQVFVETHSDHILNGLRVAVKNKVIEPKNTKIMFFTGEVIESKFKNYILYPEIDKNAKIDEWPNHFFDEWEKQLTNLI